jgi:AcrR family transcriptional regulator
MKMASRPRKSAATGIHRRRPYLQFARQKQTDSNTARIVEAAISIVGSARRLSEITLEGIAAQSGLTVRTVLRRFGSRDGVLQAAFSRLSEKLKRDRPSTPPGNIAAALGSLLHQYEENGDLIIKALDQEHELPLLHQLMEYGRAQHRGWIIEVFAPYLTRLPRVHREQRIIDLYAATDVYLWKLFRRDLRIGKKATAEAFRHLVSGLVRLNIRTPPANGE